MRTHRVNVKQQRGALLCCLLLPEEAFTIVVVAGVLDKADLCGPGILVLLQIGPLNLNSMKSIRS